VEGLYSREELGRKLEASAKEKRPLRIKLGMDPTAPDLHLGHTVVLRKMRHFQDLGHIAVLIIGDYTGRIGDPTGRDVTRPILDEATIARNAETYLAQAGKVLLTSPERLEVRWNSHWLSKLSFADVLRLTGQVTVQQMLHRENFKLRMEQGREIVLSEFMYPIMQGYDSVVIRADVELGGTDQTFNNLVGRDLMAHAGMERQVVMVMPLLVGLDGHDKMSKSKGNYVGVTDAPDDMFGKIMSIPDGLMPNYFQLLTDLPKERLTSLLDPKITHPREAKDVLGRLIVEEFHNSAAAQNASAEFRRRFTQHQLPADVEERRVSRPEMGVLELLRELGFAMSNSEARRLVDGGGVTIAGQKVTDPKANLIIKGGEVVQVGKRRVCKVAL
jgi:tyrosyl-tRNA synthetase